MPAAWTAGILPIVVESVVSADIENFEATVRVLSNRDLFSESTERHFTMPTTGTVRILPIVV